MVTAKNIIHFYEKYKENLDQEAKIQEGLLDAEEQEVWMEKLKNKSKVMRRLYIENEALLNLYIRPFFSDPSRLNEELAKEFLHQIRTAYEEGYEDALALGEVAEMLEHFFEKNGDLDSYIWTLNLLGDFYNRSFRDEDGKMGAEYFRKVRALHTHYFEIEDFDVRKRIIYSFYNYPIIITNFNLGTSEELLTLLDEAAEFYNDEKVRELDGAQFDFDDLIEELNYDVLGNLVLRFSKENIHPVLLERAGRVLKECYEKQLKENPNPYEMLDEVYCNYRRCLFFQGKIDCTEFIEDYKAFCEYSMTHDTLQSQEGVQFSDSRLFQVAVNHLPNIMELMDLYGDEYKGAPGVREFCITNYVQVIRSLPRTENDNFTNDVVWRSLGEFVKYLSKDEVNSKLLMNIMISRDELTVMHAAMVEQIARRLLAAVFKQCPELLIGTFDCENVVEVLENQEKILDFVSQSSQLFDIGKIQMASVVNKQSRQLTARELEKIYCHPEAGARFLKEMPELKKYCDMVQGHHKSWDGQMGYPAEFDNTASKDRFLIEILHISDCLDAATDFVGRSYKKSRKLTQVLEEFSRGKGTVYCSELIDLLEKDTQLQEDLSYLLGPGRIRTCYSVYGKAVDAKEAEKTSFYLEPEAYWDSGSEEQRDDQDTILDFLHKSGSENRQLLQALARNSLVILYVDMLSGEYKVSYRGNERLLYERIPDGHYEVFLKNYLEPNVWPEDWEKLRLNIKLSALTHTFLEQKGSYECEVRVKAGTDYRWVRFRFIQLDEENAIPRMMTLIATDVQERHSREEQLMMSLKEAYRDAEKANKAKSVFLSSMSHDIRTPMNGIMGMTQIAMKHLDDPARLLDCLRKIDESSRHLLDLINEVLDMSKIERGDAALREEIVSLSKMMEMTEAVCKQAAVEKHQTLEMHIEDLQSETVVTDPVRFRQILINLISNAVKYTPENGNIQVEGTKKECPVPGKRNYIFTVKDNGIGISKEFQKKLFEPFTREDNSMTLQSQGTGLGLSITKSIVGQMGGTIEVESEQGVGTTFVVYLELPFVASKTGCTEEAEQAKDLDDLSFMKGLKVLLAEDNELNREIAYELFTEAGLEVDLAKNGKEAVERFKEKPDSFYDFVFMDIQMPIMNGYEAVREIRSINSPYSTKIPIIAMTANVFPEDASYARECGMNGYVTKPIDMNVIFGVIRKWRGSEHFEEEKL